MNKFKIKSDKIKKGIVLFILFMGVVFIWNINSDKETITFDDVSLKYLPTEEEKSNSFAIMVENDSGTYEEYTDSNSWPTDMVFNEDLSGCIDMDGNEITGALSFSDGKATVKTSSTTYCYLYFDKMNLAGLHEKYSTIDNIIENNGTDLISDIWNSTLTNDGYRYVGTDPDNYICFGTDDTDTCTSDTDLYMYRIIGIFADSSGNYHYKLIKKEALNTTYKWHSSDSTDTDWGSSALYTGINGSYFLSNSTYSYMQDNTWTDLIENWTWTAANTKTYENYTSNSVYGIYYFTNNIVETIYYHESNQTNLITGTCYGPNQNTATCTAGAWTTPSGKIGIMYASDYDLSLGSSSLSLTNYTNSSTLKTGWIYLSNNDSATLSTTGAAAPSNSEWTMARYGYAAVFYSAWLASAAGYVTSDIVTSSYSVRPVFYLTSDTVITGGTGTSSDPYILSTN